MKAKPKPDNPEQSKRFIEMAQKIGAGQTAAALDQFFQKALETKSKRTAKKVTAPKKA